MKRRDSTRDRDRSCPISRLETGKHTVSTLTAEKIARALRRAAKRSG